jgi:hypothetical protein
MSWDWFATLTSRGYPSRTQVLRRFNRWITELEKEQGTDQFKFVRVIETGACRNNVHIHLLVGGLKKQAQLFPGEWRDRWEEISGRAAIVRYDPERAGVFYMLKMLDPARDFDIDLRLPAQSEKKLSRALISTEPSTPRISMAPSTKVRKSMKIYRGVVSLKRATMGTVIYGNHDLRGQYIPKELLKAVSGVDGKFPQELVFIIRTAAKKPVEPQVPREQATTRPGSRR